MTQRGLFIVLEGGEGLGKSTNMAFIADYLQQHHIACECTREPGGTVIAEQIRQVLLSHQQELMADTTELLLMFAARAQHLHHKIVPALKQGRWVLCDRFTDATYAYQGAGRQLGDEHIAILEQLVQQSLRPDCVLLFDAPLEVGLKRAKARANLDRMESEDLAFHQRVRKAYLQRAHACPERYRIIDASQSLAQVQAQIAAELQTLIDRPHDAG